MARGYNAEPAEGLKIGGTRRNRALGTGGAGWLITPSPPVPDFQTFLRPCDVPFAKHHRAATPTKAPKAWALPKFWVLFWSYEKQPVKKIWVGILGLAWLKFAVAALRVTMLQNKCLLDAIDARKDSIHN